MQIINAIQTNGLAAGAAGIAIGLAAANIPLLVQKFVQLPWISVWIRRNPKVAKEIVDELQKDVDAVADEKPSGDQKPT